MKIGDHFPQELKKKLEGYQLGIGSVIKMYVNNTNPPKYKRFVIAGICKEGISLAAVFINSKINKNVHRSRKIQEWHIEVLAKNNDYLDHDSFIDCSTIFVKKLEVIKSFLDNNEEEGCGHIGSLNNEDLGKMQTKLITSPKIPRSDKIKYKIINQ
jgi:hypothetical protein